jgi:chromosome segregation ATPase
MASSAVAELSDVETARQEVEALEAEYGDFQRRFSESIAAGDGTGLEKLQSRIGVLPFLIKAAKVKLLDAEKAELAVEIDEAERINAEAWVVVQEKQEAFDKARDELRQAQGHHGQWDYERRRLRDHLKAKEQDLRQLQAQPTAPRSRAPRPPGPSFG